MTYQDSDEINPYFDGTELFVQITPEGIRFTEEEEWVDGQPILKVSPKHVALK